MRVEKKYVFMMAMSLAMVLLLALIGVRENARMEAAREGQLEDFVERGAVLFAKNCTVCHGPIGEGHVGMPLNRSDLRGDPEDNAELFTFLYKTIANGRPGTEVPRWVKTDSGEWISYTAMPAWHQSNDGPLDTPSVEALVYFMMVGDWRDVSSHIPPAMPDSHQVPDATQRRQKQVEGLLDSQGLTAAENQQARELFVAKGCIGCHAIGSVGGFVGPNLSQVGAWGVDAEFLRQWIADPSSVPNRLPKYWSKHRIGPEVDLSKPVDEVPRTQMPALTMTDDERGLLVRYLLGLK